MKTSSPPDRLLSIRFSPEPRHQGAHEQLLGKTHPRVRRHLESTHLDETESSGRANRRIQLVDAKLRAMRIARHIHKKIAKDAIDKPRGAFTGIVQEAECQFQFVDAIGS